MRVVAGHAGRQLPFERDRRLVLRRLPVGAVVTRAVLSVTPVSTDTGRRFLETLSFSGGVGDWGANKVTTNGAVEIDLHARRKLASLTGSGLGGGTVLVDLGGGFLPVNDQGGLGPGTAAWPSSNATPLPGLTVTGLRIPVAGSPDISQLRVSSPPSNLTLAVEGGPVFFTHLGDLVDPATTGDFSDLLNAMLPKLDVENGCHVVPFLLHSATISRLDLALEIDYTIAVSGSPDGVRTVAAPYRYDGTPVAGQGTLSVTVPPGLVAVVGGTAGRVQGSFAQTRVVYGPVTGASATELVSVQAGQSLAQPFVLPGTQVATSLDLMLTSVTSKVTLAIDLVNDLDGKPGRTSMLSRPAEVTLTRDLAGSPTWINVPLPAEVELVAGQRRWMVVQVREGTAAWSAGADAGAGIAASSTQPAVLQLTRDGGLSWRTAVGDATPAATGLQAHLRLRHITEGFQLPLELRVGAGSSEVAVDLQRFASSGAVDFGLDFADVAHAVNTALASAGAGATAGGGERVANGDFVDWYRVGTALREGPTLPLRRPGEFSQVVAFGPDSATVHLGTAEQSADGSMVARYVRSDVFTRRPGADEAIGPGTPAAIVVDPSGRTALVSLNVLRVVGGALNNAARGLLVLVDTETGRAIGAPVPVPEGIGRLAGAPDGLGVYLLGATSNQGGIATAVRHVGWADLRAAAAGSTVPWATLPNGVAGGRPVDLAVGSGGRVVALVQETNADGSEGDTSIVSYANRAAVDSGTFDQVKVLAAARAVTVAPGGDEIVVLGPSDVRYLRATDLSTVVDVSLEVDQTAQALAIDPTGLIGVVVAGRAGIALDVPGRRLVPDTVVSLPNLDNAQVVINSAGTHAVVVGIGAGAARVLTLGDALPAEWELTAGGVRPVALPTSGEVLALLAAASDRGESRRTTLDEASSISQVVPAVGGARYRFSFDGLAFVEGAVAQVRWNGDSCSRERVDRVPVTAVDLEKDPSVDSIPHHEAVLVAPAAATQAEIRFYVPELAMAIDKVSLVGSADAASATWTPSSPTTTTTAPATGGVTFANGGAIADTVTQHVAATPGDAFDLQLEATVSGGSGAAVELTFADDAGATIGAVVRLPLDELDFDRRSAGGTVPAGAVEATLGIVVPPGAIVVLGDLALTMGAPTQVGLYFASQTPGDLRMTDVAVALDRGAPATVPFPPGGLCPATPTGDGVDGESCYCQSCGSHGPATKVTAAASPAGRPVAVTPCPTCGADRVRVGGRVVLRAEEVRLPRFRVVDRAVAVQAVSQVAVVAATAGSTGPAVVSRIRVDAPLTAIAGVAEHRAAALEASGITDVVALSRADLRTVAALRGVSDKQAAAMITEARTLVRDQGRRVVFE
ncbi:helix-hairpin-helix domain-containing protein [Pengzhenrongella phosphoraccumulans]|uniref:helix-hairpin-helix domain-containing protein n=1 Tax=Pengzhenrongella phosphoraccumulans TaxID=3114394 RepID=UPI003890301B